MNSFFAKKSAGTSGDAVVKPKKVVVAEPWVEKYRPRRVDQLVFQNEVVSVLQKVLDGADLPNILFYGPPGTGKTSAAVALCRQLFKSSDLYQDRVLEMNASDERGIAIVRTRIKDFANRSVGASSIAGLASGLKIIILDEADAMTQAAQAALRRTMEKYSKNTRFFLICNYISRIIDPLTSRCAKFRFKPLPTDCQVERLLEICKAENVTVDKAALELLVSQSEGDLRKSVTTLQAVSSGSRTLSIADVEQMGARIPDIEVETFVRALRTADDKQVAGVIESFRRSGHSVGQLIMQLFDALLGDDSLSDYQKAVICEKFAVADYRLQDGGDEYLQLVHIAYVILDQFRVSDSN